MTSDVVDLIEDDHRSIEQLLEQLRTRTGRRWLILPELTALLIAHSRAEEATVGLEAAEQRTLEAHLQWAPVTAPSEPKFESWLIELDLAVHHHIEESESGILPRLRRDIDADVLDDLASAFTARRADAFASIAGAAKSDH